MHYNGWNHKVYLTLATSSNLLCEKNHILLKCDLSPHRYMKKKKKTVPQWFGFLDPNVLLPFCECFFEHDHKKHCQLGGKWTTQFWKYFIFERGAVGWGSGWRGGRGCEKLFFIKAAGWKKTQQQQPAIVQSRSVINANWMQIPNSWV